MEHPGSFIWGSAGGRLGPAGTGRRRAASCLATAGRRSVAVSCIASQVLKPSGSDDSHELPHAAAGWRSSGHKFPDDDSQRKDVHLLAAALAHQHLRRLRDRQSSVKTRSVWTARRQLPCSSQHARPHTWDRTYLSRRTLNDAGSTAAGWPQACSTQQSYAHRAVLQQGGCRAQRHLPTRQMSRWQPGLIG